MGVFFKQICKKAVSQAIFCAKTNQNHEKKTNFLEFI